MVFLEVFAVYDDLSRIFSTEGFVPRRTCGSWPDWLVWEHVVGNALVWLAYVALAVLIWRLGRGRVEWAPFAGVLRALAMFIALCGLGHFLDMLAFFHPLYRLSGHILLATGLVLWWTAWTLRRSWPAIVSLKSPADLERLIAERTAELTRALDDQQRAEEAVRESERIYRAIGESIPYGVWICDADGRNTYASESFLRLVGLSQEQCSQFGWGDVLHLDSADATIAAWKECIRVEGTWDAEHRVRGTDGRYHPVLARGVPVRDETGRIVCWAGINLDISRLKEAENQVRQLNDTLERRVAERTAELAEANTALAEKAQLLDLAHDTIMVRTIRGQITFWNTGAERMYGWTCDEALGRVSHELLKTRFPAPLEQIEAELSHLGYWEGELTHSRRDGTHVIAASRWVLQRDERGEPRACMEINNDITERKGVEERFQQQRALLRSILDDMTDGVIVVDDQEQFVEFNPAAEEMFGRGATTRKSAEWSDHYGCFLPDTVTHYPGDQLPLPRAVRGEETRDIEIFVRNERVPDGRWVLVNGRPFRHVGKERNGGIVVCRDITVRKRMEQELSRSNAELEQFAYIASHDLQEPLRMVSGFTQLLAKRYQGKLDDNANEYIAFALDGCQRMQAMIKDLLEFSRVGRQFRPLDAISCEDVLAGALVDLRPAIADTGAEITHDPLPVVLGDSTQLARLLRNLMGNALKFHAAASPRVHISARRDGALWTFGVSDNGIGIDPEHFQRIFAIFQRLHTRDEYVGTGIGLAVCKKIVEHHRGRIWVESQPGQGSTFHFTLPAAPKES